MRIALFPLGALVLVWCGKAEPAPETAVKLELTYALHSGPADTPVEMRIARGEAVMIRRRAVPEHEGAPIGIFRVRLTDDRLRRLAGAIREAPKPNAQLRPGQPNLELRWILDGKSAHVRFSLTPPDLQVLEGLLDQIRAVERKLLDQPARTVALHLAAPDGLTQGRASAFRLTLKNAGERPFHLICRKGSVSLEILPVPTPPDDPDVTPLPAIWRKLTDFEVAGHEVELPARGELVLEVAASMADAGPHHLRARFVGRFSAPGKGGEIELPGAALSNLVTVEVSEE